MANSVDPDQTAPIGAVCSESMLFASILNLSVMLGNYLQQTTSADDIFRCIFFLGALRVMCCLLCLTGVSIYAEVIQTNFINIVNSMSPDQTAPYEAVCIGFIMFEICYQGK